MMLAHFVDTSCIQHVASCVPEACRGEFGPDVSFIDGALQHVFERFEVDPSRCALAGGPSLVLGWARNAY